MIKKYFLEFKTYIFVGIANTALTLLIVFLMLLSGMGNYISNFIGFFFGMILSFLLNSKLTFKDSSNLLRRFPSYMLILLFSYSINLIILYTCLNYYSISNIPSQFFSLSIYVLVSFTLLKFFVFKKIKNY